MTPKVHSFPLLENIDKVDKLTLSLAFILILFGTLGFFTLSSQHNSDGLGEKIAFMDKTHNTVKRKSISSLLWGQAQDQMDLFYGDEVMTSNNSSTTIVFLDQTILEVPENSLVRLTRTDDFIDINLIRGSFKLMPPTKDQLNIEKRFRLIKSSGDTVPIVSNQSYTQKQTAPQAQTATPIPTIQENFTVDYQVPEAYQQQVLLENSHQPAQLVATSQSQENQLEFVIYKEHENEPYMVLAYSAEGVQTELTSAGHYYWKIRNKNEPILEDTPDFLEMAKITVKKPILNEAQLMGLSISTQEAKNYMLPLTYDSNQLQAEPVLIEVFKKEDPLTPIVSVVKELGAEPLLININATAGDYQWRVIPQNPHSLLAPTANIPLKINSMPAAPSSPVLPDKLVLNYVKISGVDAYKIELPKQKHAVKYYLEVFEDPQLTKRVYRQLQEGHVFTWRTTRSGHYYYRYQFTDQWGRQSPLSLRGDLFFPISPFVDF